MTLTNSVIVLGAGLTGLAAAYELQEQATVLEKSSRPGGLVKTENYNGYWFDHVLHMLHFQDMMPVEGRIKEMLGTDLSPLDPEAWVETSEGTGRYPLQMHMSGLSVDAIGRSLRDLAQATFGLNQKDPVSFEDMLRKSFGEYFCELFMFPYNRKVWKRPLDELAPSGFQWNIDHPDYEKVVRGALTDHAEFRPYNSNGWYPRPNQKSPKRGMEVLSATLADKCPNVKLDHNVVKVGLESQSVLARHNGESVEFRFSGKCLSTIPLPTLLKCTDGLPHKFRNSLDQLTYNRVTTVMLSFEGPRPGDRGHWRYYAQEDLCFTRLIYMHNFDPHSAPDSGWGLMAEITEPDEWPRRPAKDVIAEVVSDVRKCGAYPRDCAIIDTNLLVVSPAYVVFTQKNKSLVRELREFYASHNIDLLGRFGRWEYSSMAQAMRDGFSWAESISR